MAGIPPLSHNQSLYPCSRSPSLSTPFYFRNPNTASSVYLYVISRFIKPTKDLSSPNQSSTTILKARPQVARNFITLVLVSNFTVPCASLHTAVISYFFVKTFGESVRVEFQLHRWNLSDHSPTETDASFDVPVKTFNQMRSWCENAGLILIAPLSPLPIDYPWNTLKLDQWKIGMNNISLILQPFYKSQWTHTSTKQSRLQVRAASFKERIIPSIASFGQSVPSLHVLTVNGAVKCSNCSWLI